MPRVTISKVEGIARGGGDEVALGSDMTFAALDKAIFGQPEVGVGLVPGGGSTQRLPGVVGRARAIEILLGGREDHSVAEAERWGWINRALPKEELGPYVETLARRIAGFPPHAVADIKAAVNRGALFAMSGNVLVEVHQADLSVASPSTKRRVQEGLSRGLEIVDGELYVFQAILGGLAGS